MRVTRADWPLGAVELKVLDLDREVTFYEWFGLHRIGGDDQHAVFGADDVPILRLTALPGGNERPRDTTGSYHFDILLSLVVGLSRCVCGSHVDGRPRTS